MLALRDREDASTPLWISQVAGLCRCRLELRFGRRIDLDE